MAAWVGLSVLAHVALVGIPIALLARRAYTAQALAR